MKARKPLPVFEQVLKEAAVQPQDVVKNLVEIGQEIEWIEKNLMGGEAQMSRGFIEDDEGNVTSDLTAQVGKNSDIFQKIADDIEYDGILYYDFDSEDLKKLKKEYKLENHKKVFEDVAAAQASLQTIQDRITDMRDKRADQKEQNDEILKKMDGDLDRYYTLRDDAKQKIEDEREIEKADKEAEREENAAKREKEAEAKAKE